MKCALDRFVDDLKSGRESCQDAFLHVRMLSLAGQSHIQELEAARKCTKSCTWYRATSAEAPGSDSSPLISSIPAGRELTEKTGPDVFWRCIAKGQEAMVTNCSEGDPVQRQGKNIHSRRNRGLSIHPLMTCWRQLSDPA